MQETGHGVHAEALLKVHIYCHSKKNDYKTVGRLDHHAALPFPELLRAVEEEHDAGLQEIFDENGKYEHRQAPALHMEKDAAADHGEEVQQDLHQQGPQMGVYQHPLRADRGGKEEVHVAVAVHQPPALCVGNQIGRDEPEAQHGQDACHVPGGVQARPLHDHLQGGGDRQEVEQQQGQIQIGHRLFQGHFRPVDQCPFIEISYCSHVCLPSSRVRSWPVTEK